MFCPVQSCEASPLLLALRTSTPVVVRKPYMIQLQQVLFTRFNPARSYLRYCLFHLVLISSGSSNAARLVPNVGTPHTFPANTSLKPAFSTPSFQFHRSPPLYRGARVSDVRRLLACHQGRSPLHALRRYHCQVGNRLPPRQVGDLRSDILLKL